MRQRRTSLASLVSNFCMTASRAVAIILYRD
jgi:hypothetical protein